MRIFARDCTSVVPYAGATGSLSVRERLDLEAHAATCLDCAEALRDAVAIDRALERAFAPLRSQRAAVAPGRVRLAALGSRREEPTTWLRAPALFARFAEVSVALGVALFALTGSVEQQTAAPAPHSVIRDYFRAQPPVDDTSIDYFRWLRAQTAAAGAPVIVRSTVRLPAGGRYDVEVEQVEIVTNPTATPR